MDKTCLVQSITRHVLGNASREQSILCFGMRSSPGGALPLHAFVLSFNLCLI